MHILNNIQVSTMYSSEHLSQAGHKAATASDVCITHTAPFPPLWQADLDQQGEPWELAACHNQHPRFSAPPAADAVTTTGGVQHGYSFKCLSACDAPASGAEKQSPQTLADKVKGDHPYLALAVVLK